jgi:hypothetical protein
MPTAVPVEAEWKSFQANDGERRFMSDYEFKLEDEDRQIDLRLLKKRKTGRF